MSMDVCDIPNQKDRDLFYDHMGHDPDTNRDNYQCPPAISEATSVWKHLSALNDGEFSFNNFLSEYDNSK